MNKDRAKKLFLNLMNCNGEQAVQSLVNENEFLKNSKNWRPYGDNDMNFATFQNQQSHPVPALIEKITNAIDSMLLKECKLRDIDPKSNSAPSSILKAAELFFKIPKGELEALTPSERVKLSMNIQLIATGNSKSINDLLIFDNGEGQHPDDFKETFLSINKRNKNDISFVQGRFNMGSTGAVVFCGEKHYQLIGSRLNEKLFKRQDDHEINSFGFTLVRKHPLTEHEEEKNKSSWYEYFVIDKKISRFQIKKDLDIRLHEVGFKSGTLIKLFSYDLPNKARGDITNQLYQQLNQILYKPALPFLVLDNRYRTKDRTSSINISVYGNHLRLNDEKDKVEKVLYSEHTIQDVGKFSIKITVLKIETDKNKNRDRKKNFIGDQSVIFIVDGKVHGHHKKIFIKNELKLPFLIDDILICIDCTKMKVSFKEELFMANRWGLKQGSKQEILNKDIIEIIKNKNELYKLNTERKEKLVSGGISKEQQARIKDILGKNPASRELKDLLKQFGSLKVPTSFKNHDCQKKTFSRMKELYSVDTKRFPSIFKIKNRKINEKKVKGIPLGGKGIIEFETDVQDDYLYRPNEKGELLLKILGYSSNDSENSNSKPIPNKIEDVFNVDVAGPTNCSIKITFRPKNYLNVGDEIKLNARLSSPDGYLEVLFYVKIEKSHQNTQKQNRKEKNTGLELPKIIKIVKDEKKGWIKAESKELWNNLEKWDESNIIHIIEDNEFIEAIAINMSSHVFKKYISKMGANNEKKIRTLEDQYITQIYIHALFVYMSLLKGYNNENESKYKQDQDVSKVSSEMFKHYGQPLLYLGSTKELLSSILEPE